MLLFKILFWFSLFLLFHSYVMFTFFLCFFVKNIMLSNNQFSTKNLPKVAIVIAAFNEEKVIKEKIESTLKTNYPKELFQLFIGSDCSSDKTSSIINSFFGNKVTKPILNFVEPYS